MTNQLESLLQTPDANRDQAWEENFLQSLGSAHFRILSPDPQNGPDGWPYLMVELTTDSNAEPALKVLHWLSEKGIGLVINPQKEYPDYILTYGMVWSFRETGRFLQPAPELAQRSEISKASIKHAGTPAPQYLPDYVRNIFRDFFRDQGVLSPRILVLSFDGTNYELAFSLESLGNPPESEYDGVAEALSWFLPAHYSILLLSENDMPPFGAM